LLLEFFSRWIGSLQGRRTSKPGEHESGRAANEKRTLMPPSEGHSNRFHGTLPHFRSEIHAFWLLSSWMRLLSSWIKIQVSLFPTSKSSEAPLRDGTVTYGGPNSGF
jgi:hypothetical protein